MEIIDAALLIVLKLFGVIAVGVILVVMVKLCITFWQFTDDARMRFKHWEDEKRKNECDNSDKTE